MEKIFLNKDSQVVFPLPATSSEVTVRDYSFRGVQRIDPGKPKLSD